MARDPVSLLHELDYWRALLDDVRELHALVDAAAGELVKVPGCLLGLALAGASHPLLERAGVGVEQTMHRLSEMQPALDRIVELTEGRLRAIDAEPIEGLSERP